MKKILLSLAFLLSILGIANLAYSKMCDNLSCNTNGDCCAGYTCSRGKCIPALSCSTTICKTNVDCCVGYACSRGEKCIYIGS